MLIFMFRDVTNTQITAIISEFHNSPTLGAHMASAATAASIKQHYTFAHMVLSCKAFISRCMPCCTIMSRVQTASRPPLKSVVLDVKAVGQRCQIDLFQLSTQCSWSKHKYEKHVRVPFVTGGHERSMHMARRCDMHGDMLGSFAVFVHE
jgi:hypothetical protein